MEVCLICFQVFEAMHCQEMKRKEEFEDLRTSPLSVDQTFNNLACPTRKRSQLGVQIDCFLINSRQIFI